MTTIELNGITFDDPLENREETLATLKKDGEGSKIIDLCHYERVFVPLSCSLQRYALKLCKRGVVLLDEEKLKGEDKDKGLKIFKELGI